MTETAGYVVFCLLGFWVGALAVRWRYCARLQQARMEAAFERAGRAQLEQREAETLQALRVVRRHLAQLHGNTHEAGEEVSTHGAPQNALNRNTIEREVQPR